MSKELMTMGSDRNLLSWMVSILIFVTILNTILLAMLLREIELHDQLDATNREVIYVPSFPGNIQPAPSPTGE